ncbi:MAG: hypothetical protein ACREIV_01495, partial [Planctomycetaceae bacterium]
IAAVEPPPDSLDEQIEQSGVRGGVRWITAAAGRGSQMNAGAEAARNEFLWFLHADSRFTPAAPAALEASIREEPGALHYFHLAFLDDGPSLVRLNARGAWWRSRLLRLPFGDQGFCLRRELFFQLGGYDERAAYGEDQLLVRRARRSGVALRCTGATIATSARKYARHGWARTTLRHLALTGRMILFPRGAARGL